MLERNGSWKWISFTVDQDKKNMNPIIKFDCDLGVMQWLILVVSK
ncbi:hypothetical protein [Mucilaginibacter sp. OK268]|nr:hypothetical protein [Mucilaginibacter sp. OK268]